MLIFLIYSLKSQLDDKMEKYNFYINIDSNISNEALVLPLHLRGNHLATLCKEKAIAILESSGVNELNSRAEQFVLAQRIRGILKSASVLKKFDYDTLNYESDEDVHGERLNITVRRILQGVSSIYLTGAVNDSEIIAEEFRRDFAKSLLWLCAMGLNVNQDIYKEYFGTKT